MKIFSFFERLKRLLDSDCAKLNTFPLLYRGFKLIYLLIKQKPIIFNVKANKTSFDFLFKPYKSLGYGGRGQYLYRHYYDRFFRVDLDKFNRKFNTFVDIGCSRGFFSVYLSKAYKCNTLSVDLYEYAIKDCKENLDLNKIYGTILERAAIGSSQDSGQRIILDNKEVPSRTSVLDSTKIEYQSKDSIDMISIDDLLIRYNLNSFDLLKIDVEGYEYEVLNGSMNSIQKYRPIIYLEFSRMKYEIIQLFNSIEYIVLMPLSDGSLILIDDNHLLNNLYENIFLVPKENSCLGLYNSF